MRGFCPKCADKVTVAFGRCKQCGERVTAARSAHLANIALTVGQIVSMLGCATSVIGFAWAVVWGLSSLNPDDLFLHLVLASVGSVAGFFYSMAMWIVFTRIRKLES